MFDSTPALLYHKVTPNWEPGFTWTPPELFQRQMERLASLGWRTILPDQVGRTSSVGGCDSEKQFLLVFDDGYECIYRYAFPILKSLGFRAVVFMPSDYIGRWNEWDYHFGGRRFKHLDWDMLSEMVAAGWMIGSHSVSHCDLTGLDDEHLMFELTDSRRSLEDRLGIAVDWTAFPFGRYDRRVLDAAQNTGYTGAMVSVMRENIVPERFVLWAVDAVYLLDTVGTVSKRLERRGWSYPVGRLFRRCVNYCSGGTVILQRLTKRRL
ncbi:MAG: polysaccharide deacetylase family protein [Candidatus Electryoneaceae bacterium]|nr:polysaccharide deacetylase family protein [Candidatus Electryoneaceae bacterium]